MSRHAAAGVSRIEIGAQQRELFARRFGDDFGAHQVVVAAHDALLVAADISNSSARMRTETQAEQPSQAGR